MCGGTEEGITRFKITTKDSSGNLVVNDQRMYEIRVVEDVGSGRDAGGSGDGAVAVPLFPAGPGVNESALLSGYLLSANGDYALLFLSEGWTSLQYICEREEDVFGEM